MDLSALESLLRTDNGQASQPRRFADNSGERFAQLLGQADNKSRSAAPTAARRETHNEDFSARPQRNDRNDRPERAERPERNERPEKAERPEKTDRPAQAEKAQAEKAHAEKVHADKAAAEKPVSDKAEPVTEADAKDTDVVVAKPADNAAADEASVDTDTQAKIETADADANVSTGVSPELVKMSALAAAHQIGLMMAKMNGEAGETPVEGGEAVVAAGADAKAAKQQLELATGAHPGVKPQAAEAIEEDFADFVMRGAANPAVMAAAAANDDGEAKAEAKVDAKADAKGQMIVTLSQPMAMAAPVAPVVALAVQASAQAQAGNGEITLDADKAANAALAGDDKAKPSVKPADANPMFGQALDRAQNAQATQSTADAKPRAPIVPPHEQVAVHVRKAVDDGHNQITIRLNPTELGRIDVKLEVGRDGTLRASFAAEQAHTLEALRNDSRQLERALQEAGLKPDAGGLNFSMRGDNRENAQAFADLGRDQRGRAGRDGGDDNASTAAPAPIHANYRAARRAAGGLDLAV
ncbi:MAG: flagellar hook-length control protein FliK [Alphaproteobacteria bacterium]|nr:flagellar hook-length control protein FliK [Alphaproteobacteria bacterium]